MQFLFKHKVPQLIHFNTVIARVGYHSEGSDGASQHDQPLLYLTSHQGDRCVDGAAQPRCCHVISLCTEAVAYRQSFKNQLVLVCFVLFFSKTVLAGKSSSLVIVNVPLQLAEPPAGQPSLLDHLAL